MVGCQPTSPFGASTSQADSFAHVNDPTERAILQALEKGDYPRAEQQLRKGLAAAIAEGPSPEDAKLDLCTAITLNRLARVDEILRTKPNLTEEIEGVSLFGRALASLSMTELFLQHGADIEGQVFRRGDSPLLYAVASGRTIVARWLLYRGAKIGAEYSNGESLLHRAAAHNDPQLCKDLIAKGLALDARTPADRSMFFETHWHGPMPKSFERPGRGLSPIHRATHSVKNLEVLEKAGADLWAKDESGANALHHAVFAGSVESVNYLLSRGFDPNSTTKDGSTPLHFAMIRLIGYDESVTDALLKAGADRNRKNFAGKTALDVFRAEAEIILADWVLNERGLTKSPLTVDGTYRGLEEHFQKLGSNLGLPPVQKPDHRDGWEVYTPRAFGESPSKSVGILHRRVKVSGDRTVLRLKIEPIIGSSTKLNQPVKLTNLRMMGYGAPASEITLKSGQEVELIFPKNAGMFGAGLTFDWRMTGRSGKVWERLATGPEITVSSYVIEYHSNKSPTERERSATISSDPFGRRAEFRTISVPRPDRKHPIQSKWQPVEKYKGLVVQYPGTSNTAEVTIECRFVDEQPGAKPYRTEIPLTPQKSSLFEPVQLGAR